MENKDERGTEKLTIVTSLKVTTIYLLLILALPLLVVLSLTYLNRNSKLRLAQRLGARSIVYVGGLGVIVHELSHLLVALLFGHHINDFRLLITNVQESGGALGYVNHSWNRKNYYQFLGNALIGTAPIFGCTLVLLLLTRFMVPAVYQWGLQQTASLLGLPVSTNVIASPVNWLLVIIWIVLSVNITIGGFDLSDADLKSTIPAFITLFVIIGLLLFLLILLGYVAVVHHYLLLLLSWFILVMVISVVWSLVVNLLVRI
ncbi:hypothetical protein [Limosilactobacillus sp.]|uniref:hypothetical protein n=1 Tax=Limosilactobacillus sp. TaxID=2773925 RepID=UPI003F020FC9